MNKIWVKMSWPSCRVPVILSDSNDTWIILDRLLENTQIKFHENPSSGSRVALWEQTDGRTDGREEANS